MTVIVVSRSSPLALLAILLVGAATFAIVRGAVPDGPAPAACAPGEDGCQAPVLEQHRTTAGALSAADFCVNVGYLCAGLDEADSVRLQRWHDFSGTVVVHVPLPEMDDPARARDLQRAAAQGLRAWNDQPFPILVDLRGDRDPHFAVRWRPGSGGTQLGVARTQWSSRDGLTVVEVELVVRAGGRASSADARQIRLTAAHEMGHALGLNHSDSPRDIMYPINTATSMSAQDHRSMEVLYATPDGLVITR